MTKNVIVLAFFCAILSGAQAAQPVTWPPPPDKTPEPIPALIMKIMDRYGEAGRLIRVYSSSGSVTWKDSDSLFVFLNDPQDMNEPIIVLPNGAIIEGCGCACTPSIEFPALIVGKDTLYQSHTDPTPCKNIPYSRLNLLHPLALGWYIDNKGKLKAHSILYWGWGNGITVAKTETEKGVNPQNIPGPEPIQYGAYEFQLVMRIPEAEKKE